MKVLFIIGCIKSFYISFLDFLSCSFSCLLKIETTFTFLHGPTAEPKYTNRALTLHRNPINLHACIYHNYITSSPLDKKCCHLLKSRHLSNKCGANSAKDYNKKIIRRSNHSARFNILLVFLSFDRQGMTGATSSW
jgi:hypothetical protein